MLLPPWLALFGAPSSRNSLLRFCAAVHRPGGERAVVERTEVDRLGVVVDAGDEHGERHRAARLQRQLRDARAVDDRAAVRPAGFEQRRLGRHRHRFGQADAKLHVDLAVSPTEQAHSVRVFFWNPLISTVSGVDAGAEEGIV